MKKRTKNTRDSPDPGMLAGYFNLPSFLWNADAGQEGGQEEGLGKGVCVQGACPGLHAGRRLW